MVKKVWSGLRVVWGGIIVVVVLNALSILPFASLSTPKEIHFPLQERFGIILENVESCTYTNKQHTSDQPLEIKSLCDNGTCHTRIIFPNALIPEKIGLYVKSGSQCLLKDFRVNSESLQTLGYKVTVYFSDAEKKRLGITDKDTFGLANAYTSDQCGKQSVFYYDTNLTEDTLMIRGKPTTTIHFDLSQNLNLVPNKYGMIQDSIYSSRGKLFSYTCMNDTECIRKANTNIILEDGVYVEVEADFVEECFKSEMNGTDANPYCQQIIYKGQTDRIYASKNKIRQLLQQGENPGEGVNIEQITQKISQECRINK